MANPTYKALRAVSVGGLLMLVVESKHYDWWGGWTYGYRHIVDLAVLLAVLLIPAMPVIKRRIWLAGLFGAALAWSVAVQAVGAFAYDDRWNATPASYELRIPGSQETVSVGTREKAKQLIAQGATPVGEVPRDIDNPRYRYRLWSWRENEIWYYLTHFRESREVRRVRTALACENPG